jgi:hypothetical protein
MSIANQGSLLHATAIALGVDADGPLAGVLILGESGAGKSSLALSSIEGCPFARTALVADDQVLVDAQLIASAPPALSGLLEVRGFGPAPVRSIKSAPLLVGIDLSAPTARIVSPARAELAGGLALPVYAFRWAGAEAGAAHRLRVMVRQVLCGQMTEDPQDTRP